MANVTQLPSGRWRIRVYRGRDPLTGRKRYDTRTIDAAGKRAAQHEANRIEIELRDGDLTGDAGTFGQLAAEWLRHAERTMSPSTLAETRRIVRAYLDRPLGGVDVAEIRTRTLDVLYAELTARGGRCRRRPCPRTPCPDGRARCQRRTCEHPPCEHDGACRDWAPCEATPCAHGGPLSVATVNRIHVVVHSALGQGVRWGWIRRNPADDARPGEVIEDEVEPPAQVDVIRLLADVEQIEHTGRALADYLALSIETGARRGAMHAARWSYVDLEAGTIRFPRVIVVAPHGGGRGQRRPGDTLIERPASRTKSTARRAIALSPYMVERLRAGRRAAAERAMAAGAALPADAYVFSDDPVGAVPWHPDSTSRRFRAVRRGVGLDETRLHDLRHLMATVLLSNRVDPKVVAQRGGWLRAATMLDRYAHAVPASDREAAEIMGRVFGGPS